MATDKSIKISTKMKKNRKLRTIQYGEKKNMGLLHLQYRRDFKPCTAVFGSTIRAAQDL